MKSENLKKELEDGIKEFSKEMQPKLKTSTFLSFRRESFTLQFIIDLNHSKTLKTFLPNFKDNDFENNFIPSRIFDLIKEKLPFYHIIQKVEKLAHSKLVSGSLIKENLIFITYLIPNPIDSDVYREIFMEAEIHGEEIRDFHSSK